MGSGKNFRWGIMAAGGIAHQFADGLKQLPDAELLAIGSRTQKKADQFAKKHNIPRSYGSYESLAKDPEIDIIYVASPHIFHYKNAMLCLENGKAVLCEKAFTINAKEAKKMIDFARQKGLFLMEAMWSRFLPSHIQIRKWINEGIIGDIRYFSGELSFKAHFDPTNRLFASELGGGALLDIGIYPLSLASMVMGEPEKILGVAEIGETGVDEQSCAVLGYADGRIATTYAALNANSPGGAVITGSKGKIRVHPPLYRPFRLTLELDGRSPQIVNVPYEGNGYHYEAAAVQDCLGKGLLENTIMPLEETLQLMGQMDELRRQWGLQYPTEKQDPR